MEERHKIGRGPSNSSDGFLFVGLVFTTTPMSIRLLVKSYQQADDCYTINITFEKNNYLTVVETNAAFGDKLVYIRHVIPVIYIAACRHLSKF